MVALLGLVLLLVVIVLHTLIAAVTTRFFRLRMKTTWGWVIYTLVAVPVILLVTTLVFTGVLGIGVDLGTPATAVGVMIGAPALFGVTVDLLYAPPPDEYELPDTRS